MKLSRILTCILGVVMIGTGIYCLCAPAMTYLTLGYIVGIKMILDAIGGIVFWSTRKKAGLADGWSLAGAILSLLFGIVLIGSAALQLIVDMTIVYLAAIWLIVVGVVRFVLPLRLRKIKKALNAELLGRHWCLTTSTACCRTATGPAA